MLALLFVFSLLLPSDAVGLLAKVDSIFSLVARLEVDSSLPWIRLLVLVEFLSQKATIRRNKYHVHREWSMTPCLILSFPAFLL